MSDYIIKIPSFLIESENTYESSVGSRCTGCMDTCEVYCETGCEVCLNCETSCEKTTCQSSCQTNCQTLCEKSCMNSCQSSCQTTCESVCQNCQTCQSSCQSGANHSWLYTAWGTISGYDGCVRYKYCSNAGCTYPATEERKSHNYSSVATSSVCRRCSDCKKEDTSHDMVLAGEYKPIQGNNSLHIVVRKCTKCGYREDWSTESHDYEIIWGQGTETTCTKYVRCKKCFYAYTEYPAHNFVNNVCTNCGREKFPFPDYNFEWEYPKVKGQMFKFDTTEYRLLVSYINQKLTFFGKTTISKTIVESGEIVYALTMNGILEGLRRMGSSGVPSNVSTNDKITADFLNKIRDCANSVKKQI